MRVRNPKELYSKKEERDALIEEMIGRETMSFDELRRRVPNLVGKTDGQLHQIALDAGLTVEDD